MKAREIFEDRVFTLSNCLSMVRILAAPCIGYFIYRENKTGDTAYRYYELAGIAVIIVSDFFDGFLARLMNQVTKLGQYLDPIADKISSLSVGVFLIIYKGFPLWIFIVALSREALAVAFAAFMYLKIDIQVKPNIFGKLCAVCLALSAVIYTLSIDYAVAGFTVKDIIVWLILFFYVLGGLAYIKSYVTQIRGWKN